MKGLCPGEKRQQPSPERQEYRIRCSHPAGGRCQEEGRDEETQKLFQFRHDAQ